MSLHNIIRFDWKWEFNSFDSRKPIHHWMIQDVIESEFSRSVAVLHEEFTIKWNGKIQNWFFEFHKIRFFFGRKKEVNSSLASNDHKTMLAYQNDRWPQRKLNTKRRLDFDCGRWTRNVSFYSFHSFCKCIGAHTLVSLDFFASPVRVFLFVYFFSWPKTWSTKGNTTNKKQPMKNERQWTNRN